MYSAIRHQGARLYEYARKGVEILIDSPVAIIIDTVATLAGSGEHRPIAVIAVIALTDAVKVSVYAVVTEADISRLLAANIIGLIANAHVA